MTERVIRLPVRLVSVKHHRNRTQENKQASTTVATGERNPVRRFPQRPRVEWSAAVIMKRTSKRGSIQRAGLPARGEIKKHPDREKRAGTAVKKEH